MSDCYIVSVKHTRREHAYITVWRPNDCGYAWPLSWAGRYSGQEVAGSPDYYHNGHSTLAVPCEVLDGLAVPPVLGTIDNNAGPVVLNTRANWKRILEAALPDPKHIPYPDYKGAPRQKEAA